MEETLNELYKAYLDDKLSQILKTKMKKVNEKTKKDSFEIVRENGQYNTLNTEDESIFKDSLLYDATDFPEGFEKIRNNGLYNFINTKGELLSKNLWFDYVGNFCKGFAKGRKNGRYNFINTEGELISKDLWFDDADDFHEGFAKIKKNGLYNFINTKGELLSKGLWFYDATDFHEGFAKVINYGQYNFINTEGELISKELWFDKAYEFHEGFAKIKKNGQYNFINTEGELISKDLWFDDVHDFHEGFATVEKDGKYNYIDKKGHLLLNDWLYEKKLPKIQRVNYNFLIINAKKPILPDKEIIKCTTIDLGQYKVEKKLKKYICSNGEDSFDTKHEPIKIYGKSIVLCLDKRNVYLLDRNNNTYKCIGTIETVSFDDNFIHIKDKVYFVYKNKIHDITDYYKEKLQDKEVTKINTDHELLTKNEFFVTHEKEIKEARDKQQALEAIKKREEDIKRLEELQNESKERQRKQEILRKEGISQVTEGFQKIQKYSEETGEKIKVEIDEKEFLIEVGDHKEINPLYLNTSFYKYIDLSLISLKNVKISGIDFRDCNIHLNPQKVYNKDLTNCNFEGINIPPFMDFTDVDIRGAKFSKDNNWKTQDGYNQTLINAIYDETTTYNGIPFTDIYGPCKKEKRNIR